MLQGGYLLSWFVFLVEACVGRLAAKFVVEWKIIMRAIDAVHLYIVTMKNGDSRGMLNWKGSSIFLLTKLDQRKVLGCPFTILSWITWD